MPTCDSNIYQSFKTKKSDRDPKIRFPKIRFPKIRRGKRKGNYREFYKVKIENFRAKLNKTLELKTNRDFPGGAVVKKLPANAGDMGSSSGTGRSHMPRSN